MTATMHSRTPTLTATIDSRTPPRRAHPKDVDGRSDAAADDLSAQVGSRQQGLA
jgi:hypothetical protein